MKTTNTCPPVDKNDSPHFSDGEVSHQLGEQKNDDAELTAPSVEGNRVDENQPSSAEYYTETAANVTPKKPDIFDDLAALGRPLDEIVSSEKMLTTLPIRKPKRDEWVRVHPSLHTRVHVYEDKTDQSWFIVLPSVVEPLADVVRYVQMSLAVNYAGSPFVWPVPIPSQRKPFAAHVSAFAAADLGMKEWVRITWAGSDYEVFRRKQAKTEPLWPAEITNAAELMRFASKAGSFEVIDSIDHPIIRRHLGLD